MSVRLVQIISFPVDLLEFVEDLARSPVQFFRRPFKRLTLFFKRIERKFKKDLKEDMCATLAKVIFIVFVFAGTVLTIVAMFTPGWANGNDGQSRVGIITKNCGSNMNETTCENWFKVSLKYGLA